MARRIPERRLTDLERRTIHPFARSAQIAIEITAKFLGNISRFGRKGKSRPDTRGTLTERIPR